MKIAVYPGTFDPVTNGHMDVAHRASLLFDKVIMAVAEDNYKQNLFTLEERLDLVKKATADMPNLEVKLFGGLLVDFCQKNQSCVIIRGLRAVSDFEQEFQMALMNRKLDTSIDTVFLMSAPKYLFISSSIIKKTISLGGTIEDLVPFDVNEALLKKFPKNNILVPEERLDR